MLYLVATPIGNLKDITLRALETLSACDFIIAENPKNSLKLLQHYQIPKKQIIQFAEHNEQRVLPTLIPKLKSQNACLITDAGTPGISDPGFRLVRACIQEGIEVVSVPGPSAVLTALTTSGLPTDRFLFVGFLPRTENKIVKLIKLGHETASTLIAFDSPHRIIKTVGFIKNIHPDCKIVVARELTKLHEELLQGTPEKVLEKLNAMPSVRGEITLLVSFK
ncbi:MAG: 16S rRNA (cytidine(1402)-2'-O)-methyltransferase [Candidatus Doudnabacteria bacterium]|nr:16S rRNA (cytidine(1402)-2'-O)-methyltransferase [Candidatus Doudnabacteria bacterium]